MADSSFDKWFRCDVGDRAGTPINHTSARGASLHKVYEADPTAIRVTTGVRFKAIEASLYRMSSFDRPTVHTTARHDAFAEYIKANWVGWSKIGDITFKQDLTNDSGYKPMSWEGIVYNILQLDKNGVVYGSGGVTLMYPVADPAPTFGFKDVHAFGLKCRTSVCGSKDVHYFIDKKGQLFRLTKEGIQGLGYEEFLNPLVNPVMFIDISANRVFISDETTGYVFTEEGLGGGYANITGLQYLSGNQLVTAPNDLTTPDPLEIVTDTLDFGYRGQKTIESIQVGTNCTVPLMAAIDYRYNKEDVFKTSPFKIVNREGVAFCKAAGVDLRIRVKALEWQEFDIDYINIQYKVTDMRYVRGQQRVFDGS